MSLSAILSRRATSSLATVCLSTQTRHSITKAAALSLSKSTPRLLLGCRRTLHTTSTLRDRSFTNFLADDNPPPVQVSSISDSGIQLADGLVLPGPCIFLEGKVFLWDVPDNKAWSKVKEERWQAWGKEFFEIFEVVGPKPEILLLGTGKILVQPPPFIREYLTTLGIQLEVLDTRNACSTYNLLSEEGRRVAAALLPFTPYVWPKTTTNAQITELS
ncbi:NADH dehydrogenase 1 alpha subcomplex assembly factor 3 [Pholiota molesta]|nr:NADH dehydrogenase 1 alpha subcomplex assembly factor 3 [Pholiota molesta]